MLSLHLLQLTLQQLILLYLLSVLRVDIVKVAHHSLMLSLHIIDLGLPSPTLLVSLPLEYITIGLNPLFLQLQHLYLVFPMLLLHVAQLDPIFNLSNPRGRRG